jgi:hypothetical protein
VIWERLKFAALDGLGDAQVSGGGLMVVTMLKAYIPNQQYACNRGTQSDCLGSA